MSKCGCGRRQNPRLSELCVQRWEVGRFRVSLRVSLYYSVWDGRQFKSWKNLKVDIMGQRLKAQVLSADRPIWLPSALLDSACCQAKSHSQCVFLVSRTASLSKG